MTYKLTPKGKHSYNSSKKSIQTWKYHFLSGMAYNHPDFPLLQCWKLVEQGKTTLNLLRQSRLNTKLSAYAQVFGDFDRQKTPLPPPSMKVLAHVLPTYRRVFEPHEIKGFSVGVEMEHYCRYKVFIPSTGGVRIAKTVR